MTNEILLLHFRYGQIWCLRVAKKYFWLCRSWSPGLEAVRKFSFWDAGRGMFWVRMLLCTSITECVVPECNWSDIRQHDCCVGSFIYFIRNCKHQTGWPELTMQQKHVNWCVRDIQWTHEAAFSGTLLRACALTFWWERWPSSDGATLPAAK